MSRNSKKSYVEIIKEDVDQNGDFLTLRADSYIYDSKGRLIKQEHIYDFSSDDQDSYQIQSFSYDYKGNRIQELSKYDYGMNGSIDDVTSYDYTYNKQGKLTSSLEKRDADNDGVVDYMSKYEFAYDEKGNKIQETYYNYFDGLGTNYDKSVTTFSYNQTGMLVQEVRQSSDTTGDGLPDYKYITDYAYDSKGNLTSSFTSRYFDGVLDPLDYYSYEAEYNKKGKIIYESWDDGKDHNSGGTITYEYDKKGQLISKEDLDDIVDFLNVYDYVYDKKGNLIREDNKFYWDVRPQENDPGELLSKGTTLYEYSNKGRTVKKFEFLDSDVDGDYDSESMYIFKYNKAGDLIKEIRDHGNDDIIDYEYAKVPVDPDFQLLESSLLV